MAPPATQRQVLGSTIAQRAGNTPGNFNRMPLNTDTPSTCARQEFCVGLRAARLRKGVTLDQIAEATKIPASRLDALERNDLRYWPKGLFRRSFFRDYAKAVGLPVEEMCAEFVRLFPDDGAAAPAKLPAAAVSEGDGEADSRLVLDATYEAPRDPYMPRIFAAAIDAGVVIIVTAVLAWISGISAAAIAAVVALTYFSLSTILLGESAAKHALSILSTQSSEPQPAGTLSTEEAESNEWITDAYRVAPAPRLRVRFKVSQ